MLKVLRSVHRSQRVAIRLGKRLHVHQMLGFVIIVAHASEIGKVVSHATIWHLITAFTLFSVWLVTNTNTEEIA